MEWFWNKYRILVDKDFKNAIMGTLEEHFHYPLMAEPLIECKVSLVSWMKKTWATVFSWGLPAETGGIFIITASAHSCFYKKNGANWQKQYFSTFPCTTWNDGIQLGSEVALSKALKWLGELTFIFNHELINQTTKPQVVHTGQLSELSFWILEDCPLKGTINREARGDLLRAENGGRRYLVLQSNTNLWRTAKVSWSSLISVVLCSIMKGYCGSRLSYSD